MNVERRESSSGRVPAVTAGTALVFTRYDDEKAVVLHPDDYRRLAALDEALDALGAETCEVTDAVRAAHALEDTPGRPLEEPGAIKKLLGL
jgi:hypothetical protein